MALNNFNFTIENLDVLDNDYVATLPDRYGSATNVVYGIYAKACAEKDGYTAEKAVSAVVPFVQSETYVDYATLTEAQVVQWLEENLVKQFGENYITNLQTELEAKIDASKPAPKNIPWA